MSTKKKEPDYFDDDGPMEPGREDRFTYSPDDIVIERAEPIKKTKKGK